MNRKLLFVVVLLSLTVALTGMTAPKTALLEMFTNAGCGPCIYGNQFLTQFIQNNPGLDFAVIRTHSYWPSNRDVMYLNDTTMSRARTTYYSVSGVPDFFLDGGDYNISGTMSTDNNTLKSAIEREIAEGSDYTLNVQVSRTEEAINVAVNVVMDDDVTIPSRLYLRTALIENGVQYTGSNGETSHDQALRQMLPDYRGVRVDTAPFDFTGEFEIRPAYNPSNLEVVVYLQDDATKEIFQSWAESVAKPFKSWLGAGAEGTTFLQDNQMVQFGPINILNKSQDPLDVNASLNLTNLPAGWTANIVAGGEGGGKASLPGSVITLAPLEQKEVFVEVNPGTHEGLATIGINFNTTVENAEYTGSAEFKAINTHNDVLYVDKWTPATVEGTDNLQELFTEALGNTSYFNYRAKELGAFKGDLSQFKLIIWNAAFAGVQDGGLSEEEEAVLATYLDNGGNLFFSSWQYILDRYIDVWASSSFTFRFTSSMFIYKYFGVRRAKLTGLDDETYPDPTTAPRRIFGIDGNFVSDGYSTLQLEQDLLYWTTILRLIDEEKALFLTDDFDDYNIVGCYNQLANGARTIYFNIPLEAISKDEEIQPILMRALKWLHHPQGVNDKPIFTKNAVTIGPNPFNKNLQIKFAEPLAKDAQLRIFDLNGAVVQAVSIKKGAELWNSKDNKTFANLPTGTYLVEVDVDSEKTIEKIVKLQ
jgi:hypothetical protein